MTTPGECPGRAKDQSERMTRARMTEVGEMIKVGE
jgi:hypothetical protein